MNHLGSLPVPGFQLSISLGVYFLFFYEENNLCKATSDSVKQSSARALKECIFHMKKAG